MANGIKFYASFLLFFISFSVFAQSEKAEEIIESYEDYTEAPREVAYVHLNKSTYINGEIIGLKAYIFDKFTKEPSKMTRNLYCTISGDDGKIIKEKLIKVENGTAINTFDIDSTLSTGIFTFKAYTNWMLNFDEKNHFEQTFKVIDADNLGAVKPVSVKDIKVDLQVLGEGGHILYNTSNTVGIIAKNQFGQGIADAFGTITNDKGDIITNFQLNDVGIARALLSPIPDEKYKINLNLNERVITRTIEDIKSSGLIVSLSTTADKVRLLFKTNDTSLPYLKDKTFNIGLHNGDKIIMSPFRLNESNVAVISYPKEELFPGINIFTVFNNDGQPILERLYFNKAKIAQQNIENVDVAIANDSLNINLNISNADVSKWSDISISVLPTDTKSYNHHNNVISQLYIQPYIKGKLENASRYFENNDRKTDYELDLLMLTQGWSSYDWNTIFSENESEFKYPFERGIDVVANVNGKKSGQYVVYPLAESSTKLFEVPKNENAFTIKESFPIEDDLFRIGYINTQKKKFKDKPSLYLQFYPSEFPEFDKQNNVVEEAYTFNETSINPNQDLKAWDNKNATDLDAVMIEGETRKTKIEALQKKAIRSRFDYIEDNIKLRNQRVDLYLQRLGWVTQFDYFSGTLSIVNPRVNWGNPVPLVYLDDALLSGAGIDSDFSILTFLNMGDVEYIEYEFYGAGGGIRGNAGFIKIRTGPNTVKTKNSNKVMTYDVPLRFSENQKFYTPKYRYYNSEFYKGYGTIAWHPKVTFDANGKASIKIPDTETNNISLFVEGIVNDTEFISQEVRINR